MNLRHRLVQRCRMTIAALALACTITPAVAVDWTDLLWNPQESGWGVNFVQADNFIFATFFVYGLALQPTWYTGEMTIDANGIWSGPLYATTGAYFGGPWIPGQRTTTRVGTVTFTPNSVTGGTLTYNVDGVVVTKQVTRQTLKTIALGGQYFGGFVVDIYNCTNPLNNQTVRFYGELKATQTAGGVLQLDFDTGTATCTMVGNYTQNGSLFRISNAAYTCSNGLATTAVVTQVKATNQGLEGQWVAGVSAGCTEGGYFSTILY